MDSFLNKRSDGLRKENRMPLSLPEHLFLGERFCFVRWGWTRTKGDFRRFTRIPTQDETHSSSRWWEKSFMWCLFATKIFVPLNLLFLSHCDYKNTSWCFSSGNCLLKASEEGADSCQTLLKSNLKKMLKWLRTKTAWDIYSGLASLISHQIFPGINSTNAPRRIWNSHHEPSINFIRKCAKIELNFNIFF